MADFDNDEKDEEIELQDAAYSEPLVVNNGDLPEKASFKVASIEEEKKDPDAVLDLGINLAKMTAKTFASFKNNLIGDKINKYAARYNRNFKKLMGLLTEEEEEKVTFNIETETEVEEQAKDKLDFEKCLQRLNILLVKFKKSPNRVSAIVNGLNVSDHRQVAHAIKVPKKIPDFLRKINSFIIFDDEPSVPSPVVESPVKDEKNVEENSFAKLSDALNFVFTDNELQIMNDIQRSIESELKSNNEQYEIIIRDDLQNNLINQLGLVPNELVGIVKSFIASRDEEIKDEFIARNKLIPTEKEVKEAESAIEIANADITSKLQEKFINSNEKEMHDLIETIMTKNFQDREKMLDDAREKLVSFKEKATADSNLTSAIIGVKSASTDMGKIFHDNDSTNTLQNFIQETVDLLNIYNNGIVDYILPEYTTYTDNDSSEPQTLKDEFDYNKSISERRRDAEIAFTNPTATEIYIPRTSFISGVETESNTDVDSKIIDADDPILMSEDSFIKTISFFFDENLLSRNSFRSVAEYFKINPESHTLPENIKNVIFSNNDLSSNKDINELKEEPLTITSIEENVIEYKDEETVELDNDKETNSSDNYILPDILNSILNEYMSEVEQNLTENSDNASDDMKDKIIASNTLNDILKDQINDELVQDRFFSIKSVVTPKNNYSLENFNVNIKKIGNYGQLIGSEEEKAKKLKEAFVNKIRVNATTLVNAN